MYSAVVKTLKQPIFNIVIKRLLTSNVRGIQPALCPTSWRLLPGTKFATCAPYSGLLRDIETQDQHSRIVIYITELEFFKWRQETFYLLRNLEFSRRDGLHKLAPGIFGYVFA